MTLQIKHEFVSGKSDGADSTKIQPSKWNQAHKITLATDRLIGRVSSGSGDAEEIAISDFMQSLLNNPDAATVLANLGLTEFFATLLTNDDAGNLLDSLGLTAFFKTLVDDENAAAVLTTLGFSAIGKTIAAAADANAVITALGITSQVTEAAWTPALKCGGNSAGMTYSTQVGRYIKNGNLVHAWGTVGLSAKGTSTGALTITGLPVAASNVAGLVFVGKVGDYSKFSDDAAPSLKLAANASTLQIMGEKESANDMFALDNTYLNSVSKFSFEIMYRTG